MIQSINLCIYPVKDIARAKAQYAKLLGISPYADSPYYVGFKVGDFEVGLVQNAPHPAALTFWSVADVKATLQEYVEAGATVHEEPKHVGGGLMVATVKDADGNLIGIRGA
ncbi:MAG TPA: VOC family protein [Kofleriaceae bacterium]|nr:VOC family protein [Kofleriaceae bacterium]